MWFLDRCAVIDWFNGLIFRGKCLFHFVSIHFVWYPFFLVQSSNSIFFQIYKKINKWGNISNHKAFHQDLANLKKIIKKNLVNFLKKGL